MLITVKGNASCITEAFPKSSKELQNLISRTGGEQEVRCRIPSQKCLPFSSFFKESFTADLHQINLFAEKFETLTENEHTALKLLASCGRKFDTFEKILTAVCGVSRMFIFPYDEYEEVVDMAVSRKLLPELERCPENLSSVLSTNEMENLITRICAERNAVISYGIYCEPDTLPECLPEEEYEETESCDMTMGGM